MPPYPWGWPLGGGAPTSDVPGVVVNPANDALAGELHLDVQPVVSFQIYVDNYFVGTSNDLGNRLELEAGPHRVEIRAAGYKPHILDTKVTGGRTMTYQAELESLEDQQPAPEREPAAPDPPDAAPTAAPTTIYFIPGCYLGNLPPEELKLPAGCDVSRLQTYKP